MGADRETVFKMWLKLVEIAEQAFDGHLTILKFTTNWKGVFGTPQLRCGEGMERVDDWPGFTSFEELATYLIEYKPSAYEVDEISDTVVSALSFARAADRNLTVPAVTRNTLTAGSLIEALLKMPPETPVVLAGGSDYPYRSIRNVRKEQASVTNHGFYEWDDSDDDGNTPVVVVVIE